MKALSFVCLGLYSILGLTAHADPIWIGNFTKQSEAWPTHACHSGTPLVNDTFTISKWDYYRALVLNLCFEVYIAGRTDQSEAHPDDEDVYVNLPFKFPATFVEKRGNNYVYALNVRDFDPRNASHLAPSGNNQFPFQLIVHTLSFDGPMLTVKADE